MNGIINLYKPKGITSSAAVSKVKRILNVKTVGHMGTLDPAGEGVLLLGVGKATRLFAYFLKKDKLYEADFTFGYETDTLDGEGVTVRTSEILPDRAVIESQLNTLIGKQMQMPPDYSAKNIDGVRAYALARQGKQVSLSPSEIEVYGAGVLAYDKPVCKVLIHCSSGTYIRSVCRDLAGLCGSAATMTAIKRLSCGGYKVEDSVDLERLQLLGNDALISLKDTLKDLKTVELKRECKKFLDNGVRLTLSDSDLSAINGTYVTDFENSDNTGLIKKVTNNYNILCHNALGQKTLQEQQNQDVLCQNIPHNDIVHNDISNDKLSDFSHQHNCLKRRKNLHGNILQKDEFVLYCDGILYGIAAITDGKIVIKTYLKD